MLHEVNSPILADSISGQDRRMTTAYLVQHGEKERLPGDPGLTQAGREQAIRAGQWLRDQGIRALYSSPQRRALQTADGIASVTGLAIQTDARLAERLNWDGRESYDAFLALWDRTTDDRDLVPPGGESARQAAERLLDFLADLRVSTGSVAAVTHGGVTIELLRTLLGDEAVPADLFSAGVPPCAITAIDDLHVVAIASRPASAGHVDREGEDLPGAGPGG
jgi:broad specificity phosphatase PhoE